MYIFDDFSKEKIMNNYTYHSTDLGVGNMNDHDLAQIALNNAGIIGTIEGNIHPRTIPYRDHWRFVWTITKSTGKKGTLILKPCSDTARKVMNEGILNYLIRNYDLGYKEAVWLSDTACKIKYGSEPAVLECVLMTYNDPCWKNYPGQGNGVNYWRQTIPCLKAFDHITVPRLETVYALVKRYRSILKI